jgi:preprotein translocase subunit SecA
MEGLRVSIGLEAYAQRDPLVQYKARAAELYQNLQRDIRLSVISRMFTYRPRDTIAVQTTVAKAETSEGVVEIEAEGNGDGAVEELDASSEKVVQKTAEQPTSATSADLDGGDSNKKRKRRRH